MVYIKCHAVIIWYCMYWYF